MEDSGKIDKTLNYTKKLKLLYVEDNKDARESTLMILEGLFKEVKVAFNGEEGFDKFNTYQPDIIITDINMPILDGLKMSEQIRELNKDIPILVLSAHNESNYFMDSMKLDIEGYLLKPIDIEQFLAVLSKAVEKLILKEDIANKIRFLEQYEVATSYFSIVSKTNPSGIITYVNDDFCKISGYTREELIGKSHKITRDPHIPKEFYEQLWDTIKNKKQTWKGLIRNRAKDGSSYYAKTTIMPILDTKDEVVEYIALRDDITDILNPKKQLYDLVDSVDNLLGIMIKIEDFENLEKFYSRQIIEKFKDKFADILMQHLPNKCEFDKIFTLDNGRYVFAKDKQNCKVDIDEVILNFKEFQKNINNLKVHISNIQYDVTIIISIAYGQHVLENLHYGIDQLTSNKQTFILANDLFQQEQDKAHKNIETISMIKKAIDENKIVSYFQPIIDNKTKQIVKYESLVRLIDDNGKVLAPYFFLDVAKQGKLYSSITDIVLENSFKALKETTKDITINISALDIEKAKTRYKIFELLYQYQEYASRIVMELLEDESIKDFNVIIAFIKDVKSLGVKIAIDDFGAGYSNFERLLDYQPDILKIDGCLIKNILTDTFSLNVVETIVSFAKKQNIKVVAEFVENEDIYKVLNGLGIDYSQGYFFGKPQPLDKG